MICLYDTDFPTDIKEKEVIFMWGHKQLRIRNSGETGAAILQDKSMRGLLEMFRNGIINVS